MQTRASLAPTSTAMVTAEATATAVVPDPVDMRYEKFLPLLIRPKLRDSGSPGSFSAPGLPFRQPDVQ